MRQIYLTIMYVCHYYSKLKLYTPFFLFIFKNLKKDKINTFLDSFCTKLTIVEYKYFFSDICTPNVLLFINLIGILFLFNEVNNFVSESLM